MTKLSEYLEVSEEYHVPKTMQAVVLSGVGEENLGLSTVEVPDCSDGQLLARVDAAVACASDNKLIDQGSFHPLLYGWDVSKYPRIIGHEGAVTIIKVGKNLENQYASGQRFAIQPAVPRGPSHYRDRYRDNAKGITKVAVGYTLPGLFAEYVQITEETIEASCLLKLQNDNIPYFAAALAEPISCAIAAQEKIVHFIKNEFSDQQRIELGPKRGGTMLIMGDGPMGLMNAEIAMTHHPKTIIVSGHHQKRVDIIHEALGRRADKQGTKLICILSEQIDETLAETTGGAGADDVIVAVGDPSAHEAALGYLAPKGVVHFFGGIRSDERMVKIDTHRIHYDGISIVGSSGSEPSHVAATLRMMSESLIDPGNYVVKCGGLDAAIPLIHAVRRRQINGKGVIYPHARSQLFDVEGWSSGKEKAFLKEHLVDC
jgi:threonine dehydrogenase-like Zn-dependent dehydrogenase